jgi:hypothetical protein
MQNKRVNAPILLLRATASKLAVPGSILYALSSYFDPMLRTSKRFELPSQERFSRMSKYIKYVKPTEIATAQGLTAQVYAQIKGEMGIVPEPFTLHSPVPEILAGTWGIFRETMLTGHVRRPIKEAVAAAVSESNRCPWCACACQAAVFLTRDSRGHRRSNHLSLSQSYGECTPG